jgi:2-polyprenyl-3-methyl-5-hydroxy-6-metoxy-1,4-benzoquinol methylase
LAIASYEALAETGPLTPAELAARTRTNERYIREWLEQQAVAGVLEVDDADAEPSARRYDLPLGHREVLLDRDSLSFLGPLAGFAGAFSRVLPGILTAFRTGGGVAWSEFGSEGRESQAALNRPVYLNLLAREWLPSIPEVHARLQASSPARVADIGCGGGWASIGIALAYPNVSVDGFDLDAPSIELAQRNAREAGVQDRVRFHARDAADADLAGSYDLVLALEMVHDLSRPVEVLQTMRRLAGASGNVLVMDERVADRFTAPGDEMERFYYAVSILCCLPAGLSESPSAATGTVMRPTTLRQYARAAGFQDLEVLPIEHEFYRLYRLTS